MKSILFYLCNLKPWGYLAIDVDNRLDCHKCVAKTCHFLGGMGASRVWSALIAKEKVRILK